MSGVAFAVGRDAFVLEVARFVEGVGGAASWAGTLGWPIGAAPRERRGELIGTTMAAAIGGVLCGPLVGGGADSLGRGPVFGTVGVLVSLRLDALGAGALAIAATFTVAGALEALTAPIAGRFSDRRGRLAPSRLGMVNLGWALGQTLGATGGSALGETAGDRVGYGVLAAVCALTLAALVVGGGRLAPESA